MLVPPVGRVGRGRVRAYMYAGPFGGPHTIATAKICTPRTSSGPLVGELDLLLMPVLGGDV